MWEKRVTHKSNKVPEDSELGSDPGGVLCITYNCVEQQLFKTILEHQSYDRIYVIWITIGSTQPRVVCYWNTSKVKVGKLKIHYEIKTKENQTMQLNKENKEN